jgi:DNA mismatch repair protein MutS2
MGELIASLEVELSQIREDRIKLADRRTKVDRLEQYYKVQTEKLEREVDERKQVALAETEELLETTRRDLEKLVAEIRAGQAEGSTVKKIHKFIRDAGDRAARLRQPSDPGHTKTPVRLDKFAPSDQVRIVSLNQEGELTALIGTNKARVLVGAMSTVVNIRDLEKLGGQVPAEPSRPTNRRPDSTDAEREIHLRGMTVEEAIDALDRFLDSAVVSGLGQVYVIHGKGTGKLRRKLSDYLKSHKEVDSLRLGNWNEGGAGVTIVKLKT